MATVLIADDDEGMRDLLAMSLEMGGHRAIIAANCAQGIALAHRHRPDLLIMDANMPPFDGVRAIAQMRAEGIDKPAIVISASTQESLSADLDSRTYFLAKPFAPPRLLAFVADVLARDDLARQEAHQPEAHQPEAHQPEAHQPEAHSL